MAGAINRSTRRILMDKLKIVFLDRETLPNTIEFTGPDIPHELRCYDRTSPEQVDERIQGFDVIISNKVKISAENIKSSPQLKMIAVAATGCDIIDLQACKENNVIVSNIRGYAEHSVPEHTFALILALQRNLFAYHQSIRRGRWQESGQFCYFDYPIKDLANSTLGIIGEGDLGQNVARLAQAFGLKVQLVRRNSYTKIVDAQKNLTEFDQVLQTSDIISLHCPLNEQTRGLIGSAEFAKMAKKPILINTARGGLVDEQALVQALENGQIRGAGFDVASHEPITAEHPFMALMDLPNFILTPHVAWTGQDAIQNLIGQLKNNIESFYKNQPTNVVTY